MPASADGADHYPIRRELESELELEQLRLRLLGQLDQRTGREKAILRRTIAALTERRRRRRAADGDRRRRSSLYSR